MNKSSKLLKLNLKTKEDIAVSTSNLNLPNYRFTHNDSKEAAKECIKRMNASQKISRTDFVELVGNDALSQLEAELGRESHSFYITKDENGENFAYADIHAIHYIFKECATKN